jgi:hypothetical protein
MCNFVGIVVSGVEPFFMRNVFQVVGDGDDIDSLAGSFVDAEGGPYFSVGKDRVNMKVSLQRDIARKIRQVVQFTLGKKCGGEASENYHEEKFGLHTGFFGWN